jgi:hypothetical protein
MTIISYGKFKRIREEAVVDYFKAIYMKLPGGTEENHE